MKETDFSRLVWNALSDASVTSRIGTGEAVILERIARGAGTTNWFICRSEEQLARIVKKLSPGSVVTFYFDDQLRRARYSDAARQEIQRIMTATGDCVVCRAGEDNITLLAKLLSDPSELSELDAEFSAQSELFYGAFPARENDGVRATTLSLPDADGVVRNHPH
jgi:hypothetical protein